MDFLKKKKATPLIRNSLNSLPDKQISLVGDTGSASILAMNQ